MIWNVSFHEPPVAQPRAESGSRRPTRSWVKLWSASAIKPRSLSVKKSRSCTLDDPAASASGSSRWSGSISRNNRLGTALESPLLEQGKASSLHPCLDHSSQTDRHDRRLASIGRES